MKTTKLFGAFLLIFAAAFLSTLESCKDENSDDTTSVSKTGLLTSSAWTNSSMEIETNGSTTDMWMFLDDCDKDDKITFYTDKSIITDAGTLKCDPSEPQTETGGTWAFNANETKLEITDDGEVFMFDVITLSSSSLMIESTEFDSLLQQNVTYRMGYVH